MRKLSENNEIAYLKLMDLFPSKRPKELIEAIDGGTLFLVNYIVRDPRYVRSMIEASYNPKDMIIYASCIYILPNGAPREPVNIELIYNGVSWDIKKLN